MRASIAAVRAGITLVVVFAAAPFATSCGASQSRALRPQAAAELQCAESQVKVERPRLTDVEKIMAKIPSHRVAFGCGRTALFIETCPQGVRSGSKHCSWVPVQHIRNEDLMRRASFTLGCQPQAMTITPLGPHTTGVEGCGRRATYILNCPHDPAFWSDQCTWLMESVAQPQVAQPQAPAMAPPNSAMPMAPVQPMPLPPAAAPAPPAPPASPEPSLQRM